MNVSAEMPQDLWLEEVEGERALAWVRAQNEKSLAHFEQDPRFAEFKEVSMDLLTSDDRITSGRINGRWVYNFWRDEDNPRGIWRRARLRGYRKGAPKWQTLLDLDVLSQAEGENWAYKGVNCYDHDGGRCLVNLSRGGTDASVWREFSVRKKAFVEDGFFVDEAKSGVAWIDKNTLLVGTDFGEGSLTVSGYPRQIRKWKRGIDLADAPVVYEVGETDVSAGPSVVYIGRKPVPLYRNALDFFTRVYDIEAADGSLLRLPLPLRATVVGVQKKQLIFSLEEDWQPDVGGDVYATGSLLSFDLKEFRKSGELPKIHTLFTPGKGVFLEQYGAHLSARSVYLTLLDNVRTRVEVLTFSRREGWRRRDVSLPEGGTLTTVSANQSSRNPMFLFEDFLTPNSLYMVARRGRSVEKIQSVPERFNAQGLEVEQYWATSKDGTKIPYFVVHRQDLTIDGSNPTLLNGYGGFQVSRKPVYSVARGKFWLARDGVFVQANIRGGGEFGPDWHQAGLRENRQRVFDDFHAVAEDLVARKITSPEHLGIEGGSNGGLLVGAAFTQRPDLYGAVVCEVPLLDMLRYHKLHAGASWMAEYGDPEVPEDRAFIEAYSPYQNVKPRASYAKIFFYTSGKDDRVHPGHARRMAHKMLSQGHQVHYFEHIEGGHGGDANLADVAERLAMRYVYLWQQLGGE